MASEGYVKFEYFSKSVPPYYNSSGFPELLDDEKIIIETPCLEMNYHQYAELFKKFLRAVGFDEKNILQAGCSIAFNEMNREELMREVAEEYDLVMAEDLPKLYEQRLKEEREWHEKTNPVWEERYWAIYKRFNKFAHCTDEDLERIAKETLTPWGHSDMEAMKYTDEELDAMCEHAAKKPWNGVVPGSPEAVKMGCICPVMDNEEMPDDKKWVDAECPIHGRKKND